MLQLSSVYRSLPLLVAVLLLSLLINHRVTPCYLWGTDSGECVTYGVGRTGWNWRKMNMPFCAKRINYPICVPKFQTLPPSREFPDGRWGNHSIRKKDAWVEQMSTEWIFKRIEIEKNKTLKKMKQNEFGDPSRTIRRFNRRLNCQNAYQNLFCWTNFPRCDPVRDLTLPTCRSACENYFTTCKYEVGLWRCGRSKFFNGYEPEAPAASAGGNVTYLREYVPGQPFRQNKYTKDGFEQIICTPAITGSGFSLQRAFFKHTDHKTYLLDSEQRPSFLLSLTKSVFSDSHYFLFIYIVISTVLISLYNSI